MAAAALASLAVGGALAATAFAVSGRSSQFFGRSVYRGPGRRRSVALTFDDGPSESSLHLLDYLAANQVTGTFFQCGMNVMRHPRISRDILAQGHEIGNHTFSHARLCPRLSRTPNLLSPARVYSELARAQEIIAAETGFVPKLFRAPYGLRWIGLDRAQRDLHLLGVMWTIIGHDWEWPANRIADLVLRNASPGGIICLHDGRDIHPNPDVSQMLSAVKSIVSVLKARGYAFETVGDLLKPDQS